MWKLALILFAAATIGSRADLVVTQKVHGSGQSGEITAKIKEGKIRVDVSPEISTISDSASGDMITLMHGPKSYMRIDAVGTQALMATVKELQQKETGAEQPQLAATGKSEKINGHQTEIYTAATGGMQVRYWIAKDYPNSQALLQQMAKLQEGGMGAIAKRLAPPIADFPGVPIKTEVETENGEKVTSTIVSIEEKELRESEFAVPQGYTEMKIPSFQQPSQ